MALFPFKPGILPFGANACGSIYLCFFLHYAGLFCEGPQEDHVHAARTSKPNCSVAGDRSLRQRPDVVRVFPLVELHCKDWIFFPFGGKVCRIGRASHAPRENAGVSVEASSQNRSAAALLRKEKVMITIKVTGAIPSAGSSLCRTCSHGHVIKGFRATEEEVFCRFFFLERRIHFAVSECTFYEDRRLASKAEMEEIAWFLTTRKPGRTVGFVSAAQFRAGQEAASSHKNGDSTELQE